MADRYFTDPYEQRRKKDRPDPQVYYALFDRRGTAEPIAKTLRADAAQKIVTLLNADERLKEQARMGVRKDTA